MLQQLPEGVRLDKGLGGQDCLFIDTPLCQAQIYLLGACVTDFQPRGGEPVLWVSPKSAYQPGKAIRGGIPICWPWFGPKADDAKAPQHGFVRTRLFTLDKVTAGADGAVTAQLSFRPSDETRALWPHDFELIYTVTAGKTLHVELTTVNPGAQPLTINEALHTYLRVGEVEQAAVAGLSGTSYIDKVDGGKRKAEASHGVLLSGETDRVYLDTHGECVVTDPLLKRRLRIGKSGSACTVVWNPWADKVKGMGDMGEGAHKTMLCVESANAAEHAVTIPPGGRHTISTTLAVESL